MEAEQLTLFAVELTDDQIDQVRHLVDSPLYRPRPLSAQGAMLQQVSDQLPPKPLEVGWYEVDTTIGRSDGNRRGAYYWDGEAWRHGPEMATTGFVTKDPNPRRLYFADQ